MKKVLILLLAFALLTPLGSPVCAAGDARRIALLPVAATAKARELPAVKARITATIAAWFHTPLPSFVKKYEIIPAAEITAALPPNGALDPRRPDLAGLGQLAAKLDADLILGFIITDLGEYQLRNLEGDLKLRTDLEMRLIGFKADSGKIIDIKGREDYFDDWAADGEAENLAAVLTERLLVKAAGGREFWPR
ncbi:hypothetical protein [Anaeroselena agilis]|uniref:Uncharacterized protein n=1 Tax=Anaeroselena agilis TaxID=3063788 RepID=A0ABU3NZ77_9FIRM|nr:hypothetical protein [Selenomonadales bacterium 4137-cl]